MSKSLLIRNGHIVDPSQGIDGEGDVLVEGGKIAKIDLKNGNHEKQKNKRTGKGMPGDAEASGRDFEIVEAEGLYVFPGLVDMHTHLREPGFEHKETIGTGTRAALKGGFTSVCAMPNTNPVNDNPTVTAFITKRADKEGFCHVYPIGAITKNQKGEELAEMGLMFEAGCVAFSDDGMPVMSSIVMRRALEYSKIFGVPLISHCEDLNLTDGGVMNEGFFSTTLGLKGVPSAAEEVMVARDIILAGLTGGRLHIAHVSTAGSVRLIRQAKESGVNITAETCPHYFSITEEAVRGYNTNAKVNPPLRTKQDVEAVKEGLKDGTIDVIATDHAPHHADEKLQEFDRAPSGISGIETALSLSFKLVESGTLSLMQLIEKMSLNPSKILSLDKGSLKAGAVADIIIFDPKTEFKVNANEFASLGKNTPFDGWLLKGMPVSAICKGKINSMSYRVSSTKTEAE